MMRTLRYVWLLVSIGLSGLGHGQSVNNPSADPSKTVPLGLRPDAMLVVLHEEEGRYTLGVSNLSPHPFVATAQVQAIPPGGPQVVVFNQFVKVDAGKRAGFRLVLSTPAPLDRQWLAQVVVKSVPPKNNFGVVSMALSNELPLVVHPKGLRWHTRPWEVLQACRRGSNQVLLRNPSPYVVRLFPQALAEPAHGVLLSPDGRMSMQARSELVLSLKTASTSKPNEAEAVRVFPAASGEEPPPHFDVPVSGACNPTSAS